MQEIFSAFTLTSLVTQMVKRLPTMQDTGVQSLGCERSGTPLQYPCLENPMEEEPGMLQSMGSQRVRHD